MDCTAEEMWENVRRQRVQIVQELRVDRSILYDYLRSKAVFDYEDCQIVHAEKTNEQKASKLLDILETKGTDGLEHFLSVLQLLNPGLYEKLTGQKAATNLVSERDLDILRTDLNRAVMDLHDMTLSRDHLLKENQQLKERLEELKTELDVKSKSLQCLYVQATRAEEKAKEACHNARQIEQLADFQMKECTKAINEKHAYIFALVIKLSSLEAEAKEMKKQVEEERKRNDELLNKLKELSNCFDQERAMRALRERLIRTEEELKFLKMGRELSSTMNSPTLVHEARGQECKGDPIGEDSAEKPSRCTCNSDQDVADSKGQMSRTSSDIIKSITKRFQQTVQHSPPFDIPGVDFELRLPCEVLAAMVHPACGKNPVDQFIPISNVVNFGVPLSVSAESDAAPTKQPVKVDCCVQRKKEKEIIDRCYIIDDSITPEPRARAYDLDRSRTSRFRFRA